MTGKRGPSWPRAIGVELIQDISAISAPISGFLRRHRHRVKTSLDDGTRTDAYVADFVDRAPDRRNAIACAVYARTADLGSTRLLLRRQVRYAAFLVTGQPLTTELIAGLIEGDETPEDCAVRELYEEAGLTVELTAVTRLGLPFFILPGVLTERIYPVAVEVPEAALEAALGELPPGDGSPFEEGAELIAPTLAEAYAMMDVPASGDPAARFIADAKTELILDRLRRRLAEPGQ